MTAAGDGGPTALSPDDAFAAVGNETRIQILQRLGADEPLSFSELYDRVSMDDTGNFTYHLDKLVGHFVRKTGDEYALREPGNRIVQAVLSGAVTDAPVLEAGRLDAPCPYCGRPIEIEFREERLLLRCPDCGGAYAGGDTDARHLETHPPGTVAVLRLPPAGIVGKSPRAVLDAALDWTLIEFLALVSGRCPRCSGDVDWSLHVCESHDTSGGVCDTCQARHALRVDYRCTNCTHHEQAVPAGLHLILSVPNLMSFLSTRDINPIVPSWEAHARLVTYAEDVLVVKYLGGKPRGFTVWRSAPHPAGEFNTSRPSLSGRLELTPEHADCVRGSRGLHQPPLKPPSHAQRAMLRGATFPNCLSQSA